MFLVRLQLETMGSILMIEAQAASLFSCPNPLMLFYCQKKKVVKRVSYAIIGVF